MAKIRRRNGAEWGEIIFEQEQSGLTARAFCEERGFGLASFYQWRKRLSGEISAVPKRAEREFIELRQDKISEPSVSEQPFFEAVLDFGGGVSMTLRRE